MTSRDLTRSSTWDKLGPEIERDRLAGIAFEDSLPMNVAIQQRTLEPYRAHIARLYETIWRGDRNPRKTIIEVGAGYGPMINFWPSGSHVFNVDLPEMLAVQADYLHRPDPSIALARMGEVHLVPYTEADALPWDGAYLFSTWALTETTPETWAYYIDKAPRLAGAYVLGHRSWEGGEPWPWRELARCFTKWQELYPIAGAADAMELAAVNR